MAAKLFIFALGAKCGEGRFFNTKPIMRYAQTPPHQFFICEMESNLFVGFHVWFLGAEVLGKQLFVTVCAVLLS